MDLVRTKSFPSNYPDDAVEILKAMSFADNVQVLGSMAIRSQQYAGDYDGYEVVNLKKSSESEALKTLAKKFQSIVKGLMKRKDVWIGDIKAGSVEEWRVLPKTAHLKEGKVVGYDEDSSREVLRTLRKVIGEVEYDKAMALLKPSPSAKDFLAMKDLFKYHIVRWTPREVLDGKKRLMDGSTMTLDEAFGCPSLSKLDVIAYLSKGFSDFSVIYEFRNNGKPLNEVASLPVETTLREDIATYTLTGNYFKALKRKFALAKLKGDTKELKRLAPVLNSDLGRLYQIVSDIDTLLRLLEDHNEVPVEAFKDEVDYFVARLANIYSLKGFIRSEPRLLAIIQKILSLPMAKVAAPLTKLADELDSFLQKYSKQYMGL